jgi:hypothetical protein
MKAQSILELEKLEKYAKEKKVLDREKAKKKKIRENMQERGDYDKIDEFIH